MRNARKMLRVTTLRINYVQQPVRCRLAKGAGRRTAAACQRCPPGAYIVSHTVLTEEQYNAWNSRDSGLCPSSGILKNKRRATSRKPDPFPPSGEQVVDT
jgi:hypothetical protein